MDSNKKAKEDVVVAKESANQANVAQSQAEDYRAMKEVFESLNSDAEEVPQQDFVPDFLFKGGRINEWGETEPSPETDGNYFIVSIEAHDFDSADSHRQWFLTRWLYDYGSQQYTWEPLEIFGDGDNLPHVINYFERVIVKHNVTMLQKTDLEQAASFIKGVDDDNWPEEDVTMENDEPTAAPENKDQEKIQMMKRVLGYKLPPATPGNSGVDRTRFRRPKYYVEWMDGSITLQPSNLMEKALGDVANLHIDMSQSSRFPNKNWRRKRYGGAFAYREVKKNDRASIFMNGKYKYKQYFNTFADDEGNVRHSLMPFTESAKCVDGKPEGQKRGRKPKKDRKGMQMETEEEDN